jgi:hypothetical protein
MLLLYRSSADLHMGVYYYGSMAVVKCHDVCVHQNWIYITAVAHDKQRLPTATEFYYIAPAACDTSQAFAFLMRFTATAAAAAQSPKSTSLYANLCARAAAATAAANNAGKLICL